MNTKAEIEAVLNPKKLAFVGVSGDPKKFSRMAFKELRKKGFELYPVNPGIEEIDKVKCYSTIADVPREIKSAIFMTPKSITPQEVEVAAKNGIESVWIQQGAHSDDVIQVAEKHNLNLVFNKCILMFAVPVKGVHSFHRFFARIFNKIPD